MVSCWFISLRRLCCTILYTYSSNIRRTVAQVMLTLSVNGVINAAAGVGAAASAHASQTVNSPPAPKAWGEKLSALFTSLGTFGAIALVAVIAGLVATLTLVPDWGTVSQRRSPGVDVQTASANSNGTRLPSLRPTLFDFVDVAQGDKVSPAAPSPSTSTNGVGSPNPTNSPSKGGEFWSTLPPSLQSDQFPTTSGAQNTDSGPSLIAPSPSLSGSESSSQPSTMSESALSPHSASPSVDSSETNAITTSPVGSDGIDSDSAGSNMPVPSMVDVLGPNNDMSQMIPDAPEDDTTGLESVQPSPLTSSSTTSASVNPTSLGGHPPSVVPVDLSMPAEITGTPRGEVTSFPTPVGDTTSSIVAEGGDPAQGQVSSGTNDPSMSPTVFPYASSEFPTDAIVSSSSGIPTATPEEPIDATSSPHADDTFAPQTLGPAGSNNTTKSPTVPNEPSPSLDGTNGTGSGGTSAPAKAIDGTTQVPSISSQASVLPSASVDPSSLQIETTSSPTKGPTPSPTSSSSSPGATSNPTNAPIPPTVVSPHL